MHDTTLLTYRDPRTGSSRIDRVNAVTKRTASRHRFSLFLTRLIEFLGIQSVFETGTSTGLNAACLAQNQNIRIITLEGSDGLADFAEAQFHKLHLSNVRLVRGMVRDQFAKILTSESPELIFLDADHRSETVAFYMESIYRLASQARCIVIHDIYWSPDMQKAWRQIVQDSRYNLTIDLFQAGVVFPGHPMEKQHFTLKF